MAPIEAASPGWREEKPGGASLQSRGRITYSRPRPAAPYAGKGPSRPDAWVDQNAGRDACGSPGRDQRRPRSNAAATIRAAFRASRRRRHWTEECDGRAVRRIEAIGVACRPSRFDERWRLEHDGELGEPRRTADPGLAVDQTDLDRDLVVAQGVEKALVRWTGAGSCGVVHARASRREGRRPRTHRPPGSTALAAGLRREPGRLPLSRSARARTMGDNASSPRIFPPRGRPHRDSRWPGRPGRCPETPAASGAASTSRGQPDCTARRAHLVPRRGIDAFPP